MRVEDAPAGRALNALIAEKIMHLHSEVWPAHYSDDLTVAWAVWEHVLAPNDYFLATLGEAGDEDYYAIWRGDWHAVAFAPTAPLAICRAALLLAGVKELPVER